MSFYKKKALITGGIGCIGRAISIALAESGCKVFIYDIGKEGDQIVANINDRFDEDRLFYIECDINDSKLLKSTTKGLQNNHGDFDFLINNAGINTFGKIEDISDEKYQDTQQINANAAFLLCKELIPGMKRIGSGNIVNILSIILSGGWENRVPYSMSKGSLLGLTRALAREVGKYNIRVNAVSPGAIPTAMEQKLWNGDRKELDLFILERQALKYRGSADDIANAVMFFLSDKSQFITGHELHVNGGWYMG